MVVALVAVLVLVTTVTLVLELEDELELSELLELDEDESDDELLEELLGELVEELLEDGDEELDDVMVMAGKVIERLLDVIDEELDELDDGTVVTETDVLTGMLDEALIVSEKLSDVVVMDVVLDVLNVSKMVSEVVVLSSVVVVDAPVSTPHTPLQATISPSTHSVPGAVGPKLIRPPWSQMKKVVPSAPQKSWPSGEQLP